MPSVTMYTYYQESIILWTLGITMCLVLYVYYVSIKTYVVI